MKSSNRFSALSGVKRTAKLFLKSKIGMVGLVIIVFFLLLAVFAPQLTSNDPVTGFNVASHYAIPAWATALPWYGNTSLDYYPVPLEPISNLSDLSTWPMQGSNYTAGLSRMVPYQSTPYTLYVNASFVTNETTAYSFSPSQTLPYGQVLFSMSKAFYFDGVSPPDFLLSTQIYPLSMENITTVYAVFIIESPSHVNYTLASILSYTLDTQVDIPVTQIGTWNQVNITNGVLADPESGLAAFNSSGYDPSYEIFNGTGNYQVTLQLQGACSNNPSNYIGYGPCGTGGSVSLLISPISLHFIGGAYGLLGTDDYGRDVWSQFVWGSRISLMIGIFSGIGAVGLGAIIGITGGYVGGWVDEVIGRITDFVLVLPFLPLLIVVVFIITTNSLLLSQVYLWVILVFIIVSWPFIGRIIRAQVLSVKERSYVEASRALGSGTWRILRKHILPNVMGLVYSQVALNVAGFILTEAALDYLSVSIHPITTMTWGVMLTQALPDATTAANHSFVWWWFLPPGIAIASLSLAFVLVGFALDSIFNPKLRAR